MKLEDALATSHAHPKAEVRENMLRVQLEQFRADFFGHTMDLKRCSDYEAANGEFPDPQAAQDELARASANNRTLNPERQRLLMLAIQKANAEKSLDTILNSIETTLEELKKLDPDAE